MKKDEFVAMGISEELATKAAAASQDELKGYVSKTSYTEIEETKKTLEGQIQDRDKQLKDLKSQVGDNEELTKKIVALEETNKTAKTQYEEKIKDLKIDAAISTKLTGSKYPELIATKFDRTKLVVGDDGTITGIDEQLTSLKTTYKDLFAQTVTGKEPNNKSGSTPPTAGGRQKELQDIINNSSTRLVDRIAAKNELFSLQQAAGSEE